MSQATVFISHNSKDKPFVRKLAKALEVRNIKCWVDEAEIRLGESLVQKISEAINKIDLVIAVISNNSVFSNWVRQELDWAMTKEIKGSRIVVIPIIIQKCDVPFFLANKLYADFTDETKFTYTLGKLVESIHYHLGENPQASDQPSFGESVSLRYNPTNIPLTVSIILVGIAMCGIAATYAFSNTKPELAGSKKLTHHIYIFFSFMIAAQLAELMRIALIRYQMHRDPAFAQDAGMIHIAGLVFKNYRSFVAKQWSKLLTKVCVFIEILVWLLILLLIHYAARIVSFL
jgi:uncharacterized membrane protein